MTFKESQHDEVKYSGVAERGRLTLYRSRQCPHVDNHFIFERHSNSN